MAKTAGPLSTLPYRFSFNLDFNKISQRFLSLFLSSSFRVIQHTLEIDDDHGFITDNPGVVSGFEQRDIPCFEISFCPVIHFDSQGPR